MQSLCQVEVDWTRIEERRDPLWAANYCLYSYLHPDTDRILYIGKADYQTVRRRFHGEHKSELFAFFWRAYGIDEVAVIQGDVLLEEGRRRSSQLLGVIE